MAILSIFLLLLISIVQAKNNCRASYCNKNRISIEYPFWLQPQQPENSCGPSGFNLSCSDQTQAILNIPESGEFYVSSIYYYSRRIILNDPDNCLPRRLLSLNLSSSPFMAVFYQNYTFLSCPKGRVSSTGLVDCLSNTTTDILATTYPENEEYVVYSMCKKIVTLPVPVLSSYDYGFPRNLELTWEVSSCKDCVSGTANKKPVFRIIALSFIIPALVIPALIVGISCFICMMRRENPDQPSDRATPGLDKSTIETYRKVTIGESCHLEGPNDVTCTICLADYVPKDTVRFMPECEHCFHVECIDKWLSVNSMCPICRGSQNHINSR